MFELIFFIIVWLTEKAVFFNEEIKMLYLSESFFQMTTNNCIGDY